MIKKVILVLALITAFMFGYFCGLLYAYEAVKEEVKEEYEIMVY